MTFTVTSARHSSIVLGGLALTAATLTWTAGSWIGERRVRAIGPRRFVSVGLFVIAIGIGLMIAVAQSAVPTAVAVVAWAIGGLGMGLAYAPFALVVLDEAPPGAEGTASAALQLCDTLGIALGTGVSGAIVGAGASLDWTRWPRVDHRVRGMRRDRDHHFLRRDAPAGSVPRRERIDLSPDRA